MEANQGWWIYEFPISTSEGIKTYIDLLLAHRVLHHVINNNRKELYAWQFHRRLVIGNHKFQFRAYCSWEIARNIAKELRQNTFIKNSSKHCLIERPIYPTLKDNNRQNIEDLNDPAWNFAIKRAWPYFMTGLSEMWLNLIEEIAKEIIDGVMPKKLTDQLDIYSQIEKRIESLWLLQGAHSILHFVSMMFSYGSLLISIRPNGYIINQMIIKNAEELIGFHENSPGSFPVDMS